MSTYIYEIVSHTDKAAQSKNWLDNVFLPYANSRLDSDMDIDLYLPANCEIGEAPPNYIIRLGFENAAQGQEFLMSAPFRSLFAEVARDGLLQGQFMRVENFTIDSRIPETLQGHFSFVVRYQLPAENVSEFQAYYMKMHPPILAEFEGIRNILCYIPERIEPTPPLPGCNYLIGNEVCFDDVEAFERALNSPVAEKSKADARTFPPYSGQNSHYSMERQRLRTRTR